MGDGRVRPKPHIGERTLEPMPNRPAMPHSMPRTVVVKRSGRRTARMRLIASIVLFIVLLPVLVWVYAFILSGLAITMSSTGSIKAEDILLADHEWSTMTVTDLTTTTSTSETLSVTGALSTSTLSVDGTATAAALSLSFADSSATPAGAAAGSYASAVRTSAKGLSGSGEGVSIGSDASSHPSLSRKSFLGSQVTKAANAFEITTGYDATSGLPSVSFDIDGVTSIYIEGDTVSIPTLSLDAISSIAVSGASHSMFSSVTDSASVTVAGLGTESTGSLVLQSGTSSESITLSALNAYQGKGTGLSVTVGDDPDDILFEVRQSTTTDSTTDTCGTLYVEGVLVTDSVHVTTLSASTLDIEEILISQADSDSGFGLTASTGHDAYFSLTSADTGNGYKMESSFETDPPVFSLLYTDGMTDYPAYTMSRVSTSNAMAIQGTLSVEGSLLTVGGLVDGFSIAMPTTSAAGSDFTLSGQPSSISGGNVVIMGGESDTTGGDVSIVGGEGTTTDGSLYLGTSDTSSVTIGASGTPTSVQGSISVTSSLTVGSNVYIGTSQAANLSISRLATTADAGRLTIAGQQSTAGTGGAIYIDGGVGATASGDVHIARSTGNVQIGDSGRTAYVHGMLSVAQQASFGPTDSTGPVLTIANSDGSDVTGIEVTVESTTATDTTGAPLAITAGVGADTGGSIDISGGTGILHQGSVSVSGETVSLNNILSVTESTVVIDATTTTFGGEVVLEQSLTIGTASEAFTLSRPSTSGVAQPLIVAGQDTAGDSETGGTLQLVGGSSSTGKGGSVYVDGGTGGEAAGTVYLGQTSAGVYLGPPSTAGVTLMGTGAILGSDALDYTLSRPTAESTMDGSATYILGQGGDAGKSGGTLVLSAGDCGLPYPGDPSLPLGGDLKLDAGAGVGQEQSGVVYVGTENALSVSLSHAAGSVVVNSPLSVESSILSVSDSLSLSVGDTNSAGTISIGSDAGIVTDIVLGSADTSGTVSIESPLYLSKELYLSSTGTFTLSRVATTEAGGETIITGQDSDISGGDITIQAGSGPVSGSLYLDAGAGSDGYVRLGGEADKVVVDGLLYANYGMVVSGDILLERPDDATDTINMSPSSRPTSSDGTQVVLAAGAASGYGGTLALSGGAGLHSQVGVGGDITVDAGVGPLSNGVVYVGASSGSIRIGTLAPEGDGDSATYIASHDLYLGDPLSLTSDDTAYLTNPEYTIQRVAARSGYAGSDTTLRGQASNMTGGDVMVEGGECTASGGGSGGAVHVRQGESCGGGVYIGDTGGDVHVGGESPLDGTVYINRPASFKEDVTVEGTGLVLGSRLDGEADFTISMEAGAWDETVLVSPSFRIEGQDVSVAYPADTLPDAVDAYTAGDVVVVGGTASVSTGTKDTGGTVLIQGGSGYTGGDVSIEGGEAGIGGTGGSVVVGASSGTTGVSLGALTVPTSVVGTLIVSGEVVMEDTLSLEGGSLSLSTGSDTPKADTFTVSMPRVAVVPGTVTGSLDLEGIYNQSDYPGEGQGTVRVNYEGRGDVVLGGNTYVLGDTLEIGEVEEAVTISLPSDSNATADHKAASLTVKGATASHQLGGDVYITGGSGSTVGGTVFIDGGDASESGSVCIGCDALSDTESVTIVPDTSVTGTLTVDSGFISLGTDATLTGQQVTIGRPVIDASAVSSTPATAGTTTISGQDVLASPTNPGAVSPGDLRLVAGCDSDGATCGTVEVGSTVGEFLVHGDVVFGGESLSLGDELDAGESYTIARGGTGSLVVAGHESAAAEGGEVTMTGGAGATGGNVYLVGGEATTGVVTDMGSVSIGETTTAEVLIGGASVPTSVGGTLYVEDGVTAPSVHSLAGESLLLDADVNVTIGHSSGDYVEILSELQTTTVRSMESFSLYSGDSDLFLTSDSASGDVTIGSTTSGSATLYTTSPLDALSGEKLLLGQASAGVTVASASTATTILGDMYTEGTVYGHRLLATVDQGGSLTMNAIDGQVYIGASSTDVEVGNPSNTVSLTVRGDGAELGEDETDFSLTRPVSFSAGHQFNILGQDGAFEKDGGDVVITGGNAGATETYSVLDPFGGSVTIDAGTGRYDTLAGTVSLGAIEATSVVISRAAGLTQIRSNLNVRGTVYSSLPDFVIEANYGAIQIGTDLDTTLGTEASTTEVRIAHDGVPTYIDHTLDLTGTFTALATETILEGTTLTVSKAGNGDYTIQMEASSSVVAPADVGNLIIEGFVNGSGGEDGEVHISPVSTGRVKVFPETEHHHNIELWTQDDFTISHMANSSAVSRSLSILGAEGGNNGGDIVIRAGDGIAAGSLYLDSGTNTVGDASVVEIGASALSTTILSDVISAQDLHVHGTLLELGNSNSTPFTLRREDTTGSTVSSFVIIGQDSDVVGGDLELQPGCDSAEGNCGTVVIGRNAADTQILADLRVYGDRLDLDCSEDFTIEKAGDSKSLVVRTADCDVAGACNDIEILFGNNSNVGGTDGTIFLGGLGVTVDEAGTVDIGQNTAGVLIGTSTIDTTVRGVLHVVDNVDTPIVQNIDAGLVVTAKDDTPVTIGNSVNSVSNPSVQLMGQRIEYGEVDQDVIFTRPTSTDSGFTTTIAGQDGTTDKSGGDLILRAGSSPTSVLTEGGDTYLWAGETSANVAADVVIGSEHFAQLTIHPETGVVVLDDLEGSHLVSHSGENLV
ncbi:hypothetical protein KIPB_001114, partial [Kipferlia bialata]|eukprot:g1114.t1